MKDIPSIDPLRERRWAWEGRYQRLADSKAGRAFSKDLESDATWRNKVRLGGLKGWEVVGEVDAFSCGSPERDAAAVAKIVRDISKRVRREQCRYLDITIAQPPVQSVEEGVYAALCEYFEAVVPAADKPNSREIEPSRLADGRPATRFKVALW